MTVCYRCGKPIKGKTTRTIPSNLMLRLGGFAKSYHPGCYVKAEAEAMAELVK